MRKSTQMAIVFLMLAIVIALSSYFVVLLSTSPDPGLLFRGAIVGAFMCLFGSYLLPSILKRSRRGTPRRRVAIASGYLIFLALVVILTLVVTGADSQPIINEAIWLAIAGGIAGLFSYYAMRFVLKSFGQAKTRYKAY